MNKPDATGQSDAPTSSDVRTTRERAMAMLRAQYARHCQSRGYQFGTDWFSHNIAVWQHVMRPLAHRPNLQFLEIGSWEGRSTCWLLDSVLSHPSSRITCIDTFTGSVEHDRLGGTAVESVRSRFDLNVARTGASEKVTAIVGRSQDILRTLPLDAYDLLYVDGSHAAADVLEDGMLGWPLIKANGLIVFDDYEWTEFDPGSSQHPRPGIDAFMAAFGDRIRIVHQGYQMIVQKHGER